MVPITLQVLSQASPASLENLREQLDKLGPQYEYDIGYLNQFLHFKVCSAFRHW